MRVDLNAGSTVPENAIQTTSSVRSHETASSTSDEASRFSSSEVGVSSLASVALHSPEVRQAKVEALRSQLASGSYQVSAHQIAASIVEQLRTTRPQRS